MAIYHYVYGRSSAEGGWKVFFASAEIQKLQNFQNQLKSRLAVEADSRRDTVGLQYFFMELMGRPCWVLIHSCTGDDSRPGAFVSHCLIGRLGDLAFLPIELWDWPGWIQQDGVIPRPGIAAPLAKKLSVERCRQLIDRHGDLRRGRLSDLIDHFLRHVERSSESGGDQIAVVGRDPEQVAAWVGLLSFCLPATLVQSFLTFSTYHRAPNDDVWLHGHLGGEESRGLADDTPRVDLTAPGGGEAATEWARFCVRCLDREERLGWRALNLAKDLYDFVNEMSYQERLSRCAHTAHWVLENTMLGTGESPPMETVLGRIRWRGIGSRTQRVNLLVALQECIWPPKPTPGADRTGCFGRDSRWWLDLAGQWVNSPEPKIEMQKLRRSYLLILENYWVGEGSLKHIIHLSSQSLDEPERDAVFRLSSGAMPSAEMDTFFKAIDICISIGRAEALTEVLEDQDCQEHIRRLSRRPGFKNKKEAINSLPVYAAIERAFSIESSGQAQAEDHRTDSERMAQRQAAPGATRSSASPGSASGGLEIDAPNLPMTDDRADPSERRPLATAASPASAGVVRGAAAQHDFEALGVGALQDPRLLPRLAADLGVTPASNDGQKSGVRTKLWQIASAQLPARGTETAESLFDVYFWVLWQVQQNKRFLAKTDPKKILDEIFGDLHPHRRHQTMVKKMLREAFPRPKLHRDAWFGVLFTKRGTIDKIIDLIPFPG